MPIEKKPVWLVCAPALFLGLWSGGYVTAKYGLQFVEPMTLLVLRYACVLFIMVSAFVVLRPPLPKSRSDWLHLAAVGFLIQVIYFGMCYMAFRAGIAVGTLALLFSLQPILVGMVAPRWSGEQIGWVRWCGLFLGLAGTALVIVARSSIAVPGLLAMVFALLGLIGITAGSLWEKRFGLAHHPVVANLVGYSVGLLGVLPFSLLLETREVEWNWGFAAALAYLVIGNSVIAVGLLLAMIRSGDVSRVSALFYLVPPLAALFAWLILDEVMPPLAWPGMAMAAIGVFVATRQAKPVN